MKLLGLKKIVTLGFLFAKKILLKFLRSEIERSRCFVDHLQSLDNFSLSLSISYRVTHPL